MTKRFSEMSKEELDREIHQLEKKQQEAQQQGIESEASMYKQKKNIARSYLIDPQSIQIGEHYHIEEQEGVFVVSYVNGVMAWGHWIESDERIAFPLATLKSI